MPASVFAHLPAGIAALRFALEELVVTVLATALTDRERFAALVAIAALWSVGDSSPLVLTQTELDAFVGEAMEVI